MAVLWPVSLFLALLLAPCCAFLASRMWAFSGQGTGTRRLRRASQHDSGESDNLVDQTGEEGAAEQKEEEEEEWERLGPIDNLNLVTDVNGTNCVNALVVFKDVVDEVGVRSALASRFVRPNRRMRSVPLGFSALGVPQLDVRPKSQSEKIVNDAWQLHDGSGSDFSRLERGGTEEEGGEGETILRHCDLQERIAALMGSEIVRGGEKPLWEAHFWRRYQPDANGAERSVLLLRYHHSLADGATALRAVMLMCDYDSALLPASSSASAPAARQSSPSLSLLSALPKIGRSALKALLLPADSSSIFHPPVEVKNKGQDTYNCAFSRSRYSVPAVKALAKTLPGLGQGDGSEKKPSINDVFLAALAGAMREVMLEESGAAVPDRVTAAIWVSLSPLKDMYLPANDKKRPHRLCNKNLGFAYVQLPLDVGDGVDRLRNVQTQTAALLSSADPFVGNLLLKLLGLLPQWLVRPISSSVMKKTSVSMSNVPGPQFPVSFAGHTVDQLCFFVPPQAYLSIFVCIMSYNGEVTVGIGSDSQVLPTDKLERIVGQEFDRQLELLAASAAS